MHKHGLNTDTMVHLYSLIMYVSNVLEKTIVYTEILRRSFVFVRSFTE